MVKKIVYGLLISFFTLSVSQAALVETTKIVKEEVNPLQEFVGNVKFHRSSNLAAQNSGLIKAINFEVGNIVKKTQTLVKIDKDVLNAKINAARANLKSAKDSLANAKKDYNRYKKLLKSNTITQKEYEDILLKKDSLSSKVKALEATLKELQIQSIKKSIKAPYAGVIVEKNINLGEWVNAGTKIAKIVDTSKVEITFNIPFDVANALQKDEIYDIKIGNTIFKSKLFAIIPSGDKLTRTLPIKFKTDVENSFIFDGQEAIINLPKKAKTNALVVPRDAVIKRFGKNVVFIVGKDMKAKMIPVQIIGYIEDKTAITAKGLSQGLDVVSKGNERIFPNSDVKILNKEK
ncbi:MAG: hypothetical protein CSA86_01710 [Arcobacter sp.]|nr:MAG: hypothetical protein CSA86_01710 [Arcobacter sp.]